MTVNKTESEETISEPFNIYIWFFSQHPNTKGIILFCIGFIFFLTYLLGLNYLPDVTYSYDSLSRYERYAYEFIRILYFTSIPISWVGLYLIKPYWVKEKNNNEVNDTRYRSAERIGYR